MRVEASLATNFVEAMPTEQVMPCSSCTRARSSRPISTGRPRRRTAPETSRNASSSESGSTCGVMLANSAMTPALTRLYLRWSGGTTTSCGHSRRARPIGIAEWMPNVRASYVAASTMPRLPPPPTTMGRPRSSGWSSSSTEA